MRQGRHGQPISPRHRLRSNQRIDDRFLDRLDRCGDSCLHAGCKSAPSCVVIAAKGRHHETMSNDWRDDVARARETLVAAVSEADTSAAASARLLR